MAYSPIIDVNISISDVQVSVEGFGTPIFITAHRKHASRVQAYTSAAEVGTIYGITSPAYKAAVKVFGQTPNVNIMKVGRRDSELRLIPTGVADTVTFGFTVTNKLGVASVVSYTAIVGDTEVEVVAALKAAIDGDPDLIADVVATVIGTQLTLATVKGTSGEDIGAYFGVDSYVGTFTGTDVWNGTESGAECFNAIVTEDSDFYFVGSDDNSVAWVDGTSGLAAAVEAVDKLLFISDKAAGNIAAIPTGTDTALFGILAASNLLNTVTIFHQDAGDSTVAGDHALSDYPEMAYAAANAPYEAGSVSWANIRLSGVGFSTDVAGNPLTPTQKSNLDLRNSNFIEKDGINNYTRYGQTAANEWIDIVRGVHWQKSDITSNLKALLLGQKGSKVTYDDAGINRVREVLASSLQRGVNRSFLSSYSITIPRVADIPVIDRTARILNNVTFSGILAGAIHTVQVNGTVSVGQ